MDWIKTKDALPPEGASVLVCWMDGTFMVAYWGEDVDEDGNPKWSLTESLGVDYEDISPDFWCEVELPEEVI